MSARALWIRIGLTSAVAAVLVLAVAPPSPRSRVSLPLAVLAGGAAGVALAGGVAWKLPRAARARARPAVAAARELVLALCAANEEVVWRRVALGELLPVGALFALASSSFGFALVHRRSKLLHVATGCAFGSLYLATGALATSIAAHTTYNAYVGTRARDSP